MITKVNQFKNVVFQSNNFNKKEKKNFIENPITENSNNIIGIPKSYIVFRGKTIDDLNLTDDAKQLTKMAEEIAKEMKHTEITPYHLIAAAIKESENNMSAFPAEILDTGAIESISTLNKLANVYAKENMIANAENREYFLASLKELNERNNEYLNSLEKLKNITEESKNTLEITENVPEKSEKVSEELKNTPEKSLKFSEDFFNFIDKNKKDLPLIDSYNITGLTINYLTTNSILHTNDFLKDFLTLTYYKKESDISSNYMKEYNQRAIDVWNKLALGSNLFVTYKDENEADRLASSIVNTLNAEKYGNVNKDNTLIYNFSNTINVEELAEQIATMEAVTPEKQKLFMINLNYLLVNSMKPDSEVIYSSNILDIPKLLGEKSRIIFFQQEDNNYEALKNPIIKKSFSNFITYSIPPVRTYEAIDIINNNKKLLKNINTPFTKDARERAVFYSDKLDGIFPDKSIDLMKRIASYYGDKKKKISSKDVDEFAKIGYELFNKDDNEQRIIYDTGKNFSSLYGKDTIKKDLEALAYQIRNNKIGTKGIIITSKDEEAGSGRKYAIEALAGEVKVPFVEINTTDFARGEAEEETNQVIQPKNAMSKIFANAKKAAIQNNYKTAIIYVNNFEEFAFSSPYLPGYKQAMLQLEKEMEKAEQENLNIIVVGSTNEYYAEAIPAFVRNFNQHLSVDSPAFDKKSRRDILENRIKEKNIPLAYITKAEKNALLDKIAKLTEYMSFVQIKTMIDKTEQIMIERNKKRASIGDFIESYLQLATGRTSHPEMADYNKQVTTSHECGHATNLEVMTDLLKRKGKPWHLSRDVNFITLDPRGDFLGAVFQGRMDNTDYPFEALFSDIVCTYGGYSCEKEFFDMDGSIGISQDLAQASAAAKRGVEYYGLGFNTGKISNAARIASAKYNEAVFKDMEVILTNAQMVSDLITECYKEFNEWFTQKYSKLIGTDDCMVDGDSFRKSLFSWKKALPDSKKQELEIMDDMILDIIKASKNGKIYSRVKKIV